MTFAASNTTSTPATVLRVAASNTAAECASRLVRFDVSFALAIQRVRIVLCVYTFVCELLCVCADEQAREARERVQAARQAAPSSRARSSKSRTCVIPLHKLTQRAAFRVRATAVQLLNAWTKRSSRSQFASGASSLSAFGASAF